MDTSPSAWVGWLYFGATAMIIVGAFNAIQGLVALVQNQFYVPTTQGLLLFDLTSWGWVHLLSGAVLIAVGAGVFTGNMVARITGVIVCGLNAIVQLTFLSAYPVWGVIIIALDVVVIYALIAHGDELRREVEW